MALRFGRAKDYSYTHRTDVNVVFGVSGFDWKYVGDLGNTNQVQHFIGEADVISRWAGNNIIGNLMVWLWDLGNSPEHIADRELGYLASWWVSQPGTVDLSVLIGILQRGAPKK